MRAATNKPAWYERRGLTVPAAVIQHRIEMLRRKQMRKQTREDLLAMRAEYEQTLAEMAETGEMPRDEAEGVARTINTMPLPRKQEMGLSKGKMKPVPLRKEYPSGTE